MLMTANAGEHISDFCKRVVAEARRREQCIEMEFNGTKISVSPSMSPEWAAERWLATRTINQAQSR